MKTALLCFFTAYSLLATAQIDPRTTQVYRVPATIVDGDTIAYFSLPEVVITDKGKLNAETVDRISYNVQKAYPYAKVTSETLQEMDRELAKISSKKERKKYINWAEDQLKEAFEKDLKKLTYTQGRILIKLVNRETGKTSYELVKELKGGFSAFMWQGVARLFGANLKSEFDAKNEDMYINYIVGRIERGEIPVRVIERKSVLRSGTASK